MWITGALVGALVFVLVVVAPAVVGRRLLGIRAGAVRIATAGMCGLVVSGGLFAPRMEESGELAPLLSLMIGVGMLTSMVVLAALDIVVPMGAVRPFGWAQSLRRRFARSRRYSQVVRIAARHGLGPYLRGRRRAPGVRHELLARELRQALQAGGTTFVKLGQLMSTRRDLLPEAYVEELSLLQDQVPPAPWGDIDRQLQESLGAPVRDLFASFERVPLAAASIAQVHTAVLHDGTEVIVKVQRPGIPELVERDLDIIGRLAAALSARTAWGRGLGLKELAQGFAVALGEELDFRIEARNMTAVRRAAEARGDFSVALPLLHGQFSTERVLVMSRVEGTSLGKAAPDDERHGSRLAETLLTALLNQIMLDGVFHADPHPGNILLQPDGTPALLDFGSVGRIDAGLREAMAGLFLAVDRGDPLALREALLEITDRPDEVDEQRLLRVLGQFSARHLGHGSAPDVEMFSDLFRIVADFRLAVPPEIAAVFRALATLEGSLVQLSPGFNMLEASRTYATARLGDRMGPHGARDAARDELVALLPVLRRLPRRLDRLGGALEEGRLGVNVRLFADPRDRRVVGELVGRVVHAVVGIFLGFAGLQLLGMDGGPRVSENLELYGLAGGNLLVLSAAIVLRTLYVTSRPME
ncbi:ABC1 kinase family protein [Streptomyces sp. NPDC055815]